MHVTRHKLYTLIGKYQINQKEQRMMRQQKSLKKALCPAVERENYYVKFDPCWPNGNWNNGQVCFSVPPIYAWTAERYTGKTFGP